MRTIKSEHEVLNNEDQQFFIDNLNVTPAIRSNEYNFFRKDRSIIMIFII